MLRNYLLIFARKMLRRKAFAAINVAGLSVSFAGVILISLYVTNELSFDRFHERADDIYRMYVAYAKPGDAIEDEASTPPNLGPLLAQKFDGVQSATRVFETDASMLVQTGDRSFNEQHVYEVDSSFFTIFTGKFLAGNRTTALSQPKSVVLARSAETVFLVVGIMQSTKK
jgi:putative ABC transport system permease protein